MIKYSNVICVLFLVFLVVACAPIDGLGGEEDNLPDIKSTEEEVIEPLDSLEVTQEEVVAEEEEVSVIPEVEAVEVQFVRIKADALNVRSDASIEAERLTKVHDRQIYEVLDSKKDLGDLLWYKIEAPDGIIGWVSSDYCVGGATYVELDVD